MHSIEPGRYLLRPITDDHGEWWFVRTVETREGGGYTTGPFASQASAAQFAAEQ
jgi:hypothetical protein